MVLVRVLISLHRGFREIRLFPEGKSTVGNDQRNDAAVKIPDTNNSRSGEQVGATTFNGSLYSNICDVDLMRNLRCDSFHNAATHLQ